MSITHLLLAAIAGCTAPGAHVAPQAPTLPTDPFQRVAVRAIAGEFGTLKDWQYVAYSIGLERGVTCQGYTYLTSYGPWESPSISGGPYASQSLPGGRRRLLNTTMCASDRGLPFGTVIWANGCLRVVRDRGGWVTVPRARAKHKRNDRNLDFYTLIRDQHYSRSTPYAVICEDKDVHRWTPGTVIPGD